MPYRGESSVEVVSEGITEAVASGVVMVGGSDADVTDTSEACVKLPAHHGVDVPVR